MIAAQVSVSGGGVLGRNLQSSSWLTSCIPCIHFHYIAIDNVPEQDGSSRKSGSGDANYTTEDVLKEAQLKNKMYELNDQLAQKEALLKEINSNNTTFNVFHDKFEVRH